MLKLVDELTHYTSSLPVKCTLKPHRIQHHINNTHTTEEEILAADITYKDLSFHYLE
jgi:hypothetical protein